MNSTTAKYVLLTPTAQAPKRGSEAAAGLDVCADFFGKDGAPRSLFDGRDHHELTQAETEDPFFILKPGHRILVPLGIAMSTSSDIYPRIAPRSGLALKQGLEILGGVVDSDYTGEIAAICKNGDPEHALKLVHGMRIAQLILTYASLENPIEVVALDEHQRGSGGFGSTGV